MASSKPPTSNYANAASLPARAKQLQNGGASQPRSINKPLPQDAPTSDKHAHDRIVFITASFIGLQSTLTLSNGDRFSGIFSSCLFDAPQPKYLFKMTKKLSGASTADAQSNGIPQDQDQYVGQGDEHVMQFDIRQVASLDVSNVSTDKIQAKQSNGASAGFRTDSDISAPLAGKERELQRWQPDQPGEMALSLNGTRNGHWDQFEANERLYGVKTDYDESFYTTTIDRSNPSYRERVAAADRIAREIESSAVTNAHIAEERGLPEDNEDGLDEEDRFSGVRRDLAPLTASIQNRYTPPARRQPTGHSTVRGAPVDPAIISSQLARPESASKLPAASSARPQTSDQQTDFVKTALGGGNASNAEGGSLGSPSKASEKPTIAETAPDSSSLSKDESTKSSTTATRNIEKEVYHQFKDFSNNEKLQLAKIQKEKRINERIVKLNDLKKFAQNFKLKTEVPKDMLGILANDKEKQAAIVAKAKKEADAQPKETNSSATTSTINPAASTRTSPNKQMVPSRPDLANSSTQQASFDRMNRGSRATQFPPGQPIGHSNTRSPHNPAAARGGFAARLTAMQNRHGNKGYPNLPVPLQPPATGSGNAEVATNAVATPTSATSLKFNAQTAEFKPNPTAVSFSPIRSASRNSTSPPASRARLTPSSKRSSFFGEKRPSGPKKSITDGFNPIARMRAQAEKDNKTKEYASNGGIPNAFRVPPTWDHPEKNNDKSYTQVLEKTNPNAPAAISGPMPVPHQHQLPPHLQSQGQGPMQSPNASVQQPAYVQYPQGAGNEQYMQDPRLQMPMGNQAGYGSARFQQPGMYMAGPMMNQGQLMFPQPQYGQPMPMMRQLSNNGMVRSPSQMGPSMIPNVGGGSPYMGMPMQGQVPAFSPGAPQGYPQMAVAQAPMMANGFPSPRPGPPMMMASASQQGQMMYPTMSQSGQYFAPQQQGQPMAMRPGMPMQQPSFNSSPHMSHHFPAQRQHSSYGYQMSPGMNRHGSVNGSQDGNK